MRNNTKERRVSLVPSAYRSTRLTKRGHDPKKQANRQDKSRPLCTAILYALKCAIFGERGRQKGVHSGLER